MKILAARSPFADAKALREFAKGNQLLVLKGGLLGADRHVVAVDDISFAVPAGGVLGIVVFLATRGQA